MAIARGGEPMNSIEVKNLSKTYKKSDFALKDVSFSLPSGSIMGFIGENGAGKTTTLKLILNLLHKQGGEIQILGQEMTDANTDLRQDIGVVFDTNCFDGRLNAKKVNSIMGSIYKQWDSQYFSSLLKQFNIPMGKKIKAYSRGMTMTLSLAVALSHKPKLLILDEPTGGLDPVRRDQFLDLFLDFIQEEDRSILLSSHITSDLEKIADYITFIHKGKVAISTTKDELIYNYGIVRGSKEDLSVVDPADIVGRRTRENQESLLVQNKDQVAEKYPNLFIDNSSLEDIMLYVQG